MCLRLKMNARAISITKLYNKVEKFQGLFTRKNE